jgi:DNA replicative helicase MCM subunit Mcm2 (Cdc46/Mcm family)
MTELRKMQWNNHVWSALCASITPMPPIIRKRALLKIIKTSEELAKKRNSNIVEKEDLINAIYKKVPSSVRKMCLDSLLEFGISPNN